MSNRSKDYHLRQFKTPYYSTVAFAEFLGKNHCIDSDTKVLDIGAGYGANIYYFAQKYPNTEFLGIDYNRRLISEGNKILPQYSLPNVQLNYGDWFKLPRDWINRFEGIFNVHTLCCFKHLFPALEALISLKPRWLAFNSLFYEGPLDVLIHIRDHTSGGPDDTNPDADFNIFSLPIMQEFLHQRGYSNFTYEKFQIPVDLARPKDGCRGTYTIKTDFESRSQFSGPVYLPWYFVLAIKA